jgi:hypothetical protein
MAEITPEMVKQTYIMSKKICNNEIDRYNGIKILHDKYGMNENSASMYINNFRYMINGQAYGRIMKTEDTNYFLMQIFNDYGEIVFKKALFALKGHIEYIKSINKPSNVEQLYNDLIKKYSINNEIISNSISDKNDVQSENKTNNENSNEILNFTYERDLQTALIRQAEKLFSGYKIYGENLDGVEYQIEGKRIDLLLENNNSSELLAIELKAGIADFKVFGQISMYLGLLKKEFPQKNVKGIIIAGEIDNSLKYAVLTNANIKIMSYKMEITLSEIA